MIYPFLWVIFIDWYQMGKSPGLSLLNEAFLDQLPPEERQEIVHKGSMVDGSASGIKLHLLYYQRLG